MPKSCFITAIAVMSLDGRIARDANDQINWSSSEDKKQLHDFLQHQTDVCVMGRKSYDICQSVFVGRYPVIILSRQHQQPLQLEKDIWVINPKVTHLLDYCYQQYGPKIAWLGGPQIYNYGFRNGLIDALRLTIEPILLGQGLALCYNVNLPPMRVETTQLLNDQGTILINYQVIK